VDYPILPFVDAPQLPQSVSHSLAAFGGVEPVAYPTIMAYKQAFSISPIRIISILFY
jgi:hypothetical protein